MKSRITNKWRETLLRLLGCFLFALMLVGCGGDSEETADVAAIEGEESTADAGAVSSVNAEESVVVSMMVYPVTPGCRGFSRFCPTPAKASTPGDMLFTVCEVSTSS